MPWRRSGPSGWSARSRRCLRGVGDVGPVGADAAVWERLEVQLLSRLDDVLRDCPRVATAERAGLDVALAVPAEVAAGAVGVVDLDEPEHLLVIRHGDGRERPAPRVLGVQLSAPTLVLVVLGDGSRERVRPPGLGCHVLLLLHDRFIMSCHTPAVNRREAGDSQYPLTVFVTRSSAPSARGGCPA